MHALDKNQTQTWSFLDKKNDCQQELHDKILFFKMCRQTQPLQSQHICVSFVFIFIYIPFSFQKKKKICSQGIIY